MDTPMPNVPPVNPVVPSPMPAPVAAPSVPTTPPPASPAIAALYHPSEPPAPPTPVASSAKPSDKLFSKPTPPPPSMHSEKESHLGRALMTLAIVVILLGGTGALGYFVFPDTFYGVIGKYAGMEDPAGPAVIETPEVTEPEVVEPEVTEPEVTEPEVTEPVTTETDVTEPDVTEPQVDDGKIRRPRDEDSVSVRSAASEECGQDFACFVNAGEKCTPASVEYSDSDTTNYLEIRGPERDTCTLYIQERPSQLSGTCTVDPAKLAKILTDWNSSSLLIDDLNTSVCVGSLFEAE